MALPKLQPEQKEQEGMCLGRREYQAGVHLGGGPAAQCLLRAGMGQQAWRERAPSNVEM